MSTGATAPSDTVKKKPQRRFQFIDNTDSASTGKNSTQVRRHVMQEYMREKRWEARSKAEALFYPETSDPQLSAVADPTVVSSNKSARQRRQQKHRPFRADLPNSINLNGLEQDDFTKGYNLSSGKVETCSPETVLSQQPLLQGGTVGSTLKKTFYLTPQCFARLADMFPIEPPSPAQTVSTGSSFSPPRSARKCDVSPVTNLSAARTDPFNVLPMKLSRTDQELFDFYAVVMPSCSYGFERRNPRAHNWYRDVFVPEAMKGAVTFQNTILVHAANTQAWVKGLTETDLALEHRGRALRMLNQHYQQHPNDTSDAVITATMSAAALEDFDPRLERRHFAWLHWSAAMHKIRQRGGPAFLEGVPSLRKLINWQDYIFSGYDGRGSTFYFTTESSFVSSSEVEKEMHGRQEIKRQCEDFLTFVKCTEHLAAVAASQLHNPLARKTQPLRFSVFSPDHPLYVLIASPNKERYTTTGQLKQIISRLAALMTINVAIWEYRYDTMHSEAFFEELVNNIMYNDLERNISVEALLQILLSGSNNSALQHTERPWLVGRLLKVAKRLSRPSWERLNDFLLSCLTLDGTFGAQTQAWEEDLRREIVQAPLVSHLLPLMQT